MKLNTISNVVHEVLHNVVLSTWKMNGCLQQCLVQQCLELGSSDRMNDLAHSLLIASISMHRASLGPVDSLFCSAYIMKGPLSKTKSWVLQAHDLPYMFQMLLLKSCVVNRPVVLAGCMSAWHPCCSSLLRQKGRLSKDSLVASMTALRCCRDLRFSAALLESAVLLGIGKPVSLANCGAHLQDACESSCWLQILCMGLSMECMQLSCLQCIYVCIPMCKLFEI